jgi:hypothetical protein
MQFIIDKSQINSCESKIIHFYCIKNNIKCFYKERSDFVENAIPIGTVDFVQNFYGKNFIPNYYPEFLNRFIGRKIWNFSEIPIEECFIKPADKYKRFEGKISSKLVGKERAGPYWCSEIVNFQKEWRVYAADGEVIASYYYLGEEEEILPPKINIRFPKSFCGAIDFGLLDSKVELIESHHPFACGWYGGFSEGKKYIDWIIAGHNFLLAQINK